MAKTIFLTSGTTWTAPPDFDPNNNTIECWGGGGGGGTGNGGQGGGGGAYSRIVNAQISPGTVLSIGIGAGGAGGAAGVGANGSSGGNTFIAGYIQANGGTGGRRLGQPAAAGGQAAEGVGTVRYSGGNGGLSINSGFAGGAAGGGGAGAAGNGFNGANLNGDNGGRGGDGGPPGGGAGGRGGFDSTFPSPGTDGILTEVANESGGGGGGGGSQCVGDAGANFIRRRPGAAGGSPGGGGGGDGGNAGDSPASFGGGNGAPGLIKITYGITVEIIPGVEVVPTGDESRPNRTPGPISMTAIASAFRTAAGVIPATPRNFSRYYARAFANDGLPLVLRYGYGIQWTPTYTQAVSNSGQIKFSGFKGAFQQLALRSPITINASTSYIPLNTLYAQYDVVQYSFTGAPQTFNFLNARVIQIECWGAQGSYFNGSTDVRTDGGYSRGVYVSPTGGSLYVYVGGVPPSDGANGFVLGGWNGGGVGFQGPISGATIRRGGGGGASDVRTVYIGQVLQPIVYGRDGTIAINGDSITALNPYWTTSPTLASLNSRLIVAGGGGSGGLYLPGPVTGIGGVGGGNEGGPGSYTVPQGGGGVNAGTGGTQSSGGATTGSQGRNGGFGYGDSGRGYNGTYYPGSGGGGGWYGGGSGNAGDSGGGSGYVGGMLPNTSTGSLNFGVTTVNAQPGQAGYVSNSAAPNGLVRITIIG